MSYLTLIGTGLSYAAQMLSSGSITTSTVEASDITEEKLNLEGFTSALRIAMFPFAQNARVKVEKYAFNFDFPEPVLGIDTTAIKRTLMNLAWKDESGIGYKNLVKVKRIANIMLELFPPIPLAIDKPKADITKIYEFFIQGLECLAKKYFSDETLRTMREITEIPDPAIFDYDPHKDARLSEQKAARAVQETINLVKYYLWKHREPLNQLSSIQQKIKESYPPCLIAQFANGLELLKNIQGNVPTEKRWKCRYEFLSLDVLISGCLSRFKQIRTDVSTIEPSRKKIDLDAKQTGGATPTNKHNPTTSTNSFNRTLVGPNVGENSEENKEKKQKTNDAQKDVPAPDLTVAVIDSNPPIEGSSESSSSSS